MFWIILTLIIFIIGLVLIWKEVKTDGVLSCIGSTFFTGITMFIVCGLSLYITNGLVYDLGAKTERQYIETQEIICIEDNLINVGDFFLGTGTENSEAVYYAMVKTDKGYQMQDFKREKSYIQYSIEHYRIETYCDYFTNPIIRFFAGDGYRE
jgi:hypothetical protein